MLSRHFRCLQNSFKKVSWDFEKSKLSACTGKDSKDCAMTVSVQSLIMRRGDRNWCSLKAGLKKSIVALWNNFSFLFQWERGGQPKIVTKVETEEELVKIFERAIELGIVASIIQDAGHTQVAPGSRTVVNGQN